MFSSHQNFTQCIMCLRSSRAYTDFEQVTLKLKNVIVEFKNAFNETPLTNYKMQVSPGPRVKRSLMTQCLLQRRGLQRRRVIKVWAVEVCNQTEFNQFVLRACVTTNVRQEDLDHELQLSQLGYSSRQGSQITNCEMAPCTLPCELEAQERSRWQNLVLV